MVCIIETTTTDDVTTRTPAADSTHTHILYEPGCVECEISLCESVIRDHEAGSYPARNHMIPADYDAMIQRWRDRLASALESRR